jgi:hypothetical protein
MSALPSLDNSFALRNAAVILELESQSVVVLIDPEGRTERASSVP